MKEIERLRNLLCDNGVDPDGDEDAPKRVSIDAFKGTTSDTKEDLRLKMKRSLKEAAFDLVERAECDDDITRKQAEYFRDFDLLIDLN